MVIENDETKTLAHPLPPVTAPPPPKVYRGSPRFGLRELTEKNVEDYGFRFDSDLFRATTPKPNCRP